MRNGTGASTDQPSSVPLVPAGQQLDHPILPASEHAILSLEWVRELRDTRIAEWSRQLKEAGLEDFAILTRGAVHNGHYTGPKPIDTTWSSHIPEPFRQKYGRVVEIDLLITIPESLRPDDPKVLGPIEKVIQPVGTLSWKATNEWGFPVESHYVYRFEDLLPDRGIGLELEIGIYRRPLCLVDTYWDALFAPDEIGWQSDIRRNLADADVPYKQEILAVKDFQWRCAAARLTAACGLLEIASTLDQNGLDGQTVRSMLPVELVERLQRHPPNPQMLGPNIKSWLLGQHSGNPLQIVDDSWPKAALDVLAKYDSGSLQKAPAPPNWVRMAVAIHELRERADLGEFATKLSDALTRQRSNGSVNLEHWSGDTA